MIALPFELIPPVGAVLTAQEAILSGRDAEHIDLLADGVVNVRDVPEGARMLSVTVHWGAEDIWATYYWALDEPAEWRFGPIAAQRYYPDMIVRAAVVATAVVALMLLVSFVLPAFGNPVALLVVPVLAAGLSLVKSRRWRLGLGVAASVVFLVFAWAATQPSYIAA